MTNNKEWWLESIYSDGSRFYVSNPSPRLYEKITVKLTCYEDAPVDKVFLRALPNGAEEVTEAVRKESARGLAVFEAEITIHDPRTQYQFYILAGNTIYYYSQAGVTTYVQDNIHDFVIMTDYHDPAWVKEQVFYQIFPDRFCNGNKDNDVKDGEFEQYGFKAIAHDDWNEPPLPAHESGGFEFYGGDLEGIIEKIPYFKKLGVTALYLNPIFLAPSAHKYDCADYFAVDPHFGGDKALAELSKALHDEGMKLVLDISINHTGTANKWFNKECLLFDRSEGAYNNPDAAERDFYYFGEDNSYKGWFDIPSLPVLNYHSQKLRSLVYKDEDSALKKWLKAPYSIDGWRFDVADVFARNDEHQLARELWPEITASIKEENKDAYIVAEDWGDCSGYLQGKEWDSPMNYFGCARVFRQFLGEDDLFIGRVEGLKNCGYHMKAEDAAARIRSHFDKLPGVIREIQFNLLGSHDVPRLHNNPKVNRDELKGAVIMQFMLPGSPCIYYGDEAGIDGYVGDDAGCRYPMPWDSGFEEGEIFKFYQTLTGLKVQTDEFKYGSWKILYAEGDVLAMARFSDKEAYVGIMSVADEDKEIELPLASIGFSQPESKEDIFGSSINMISNDGRSLRLNIKAHTPYLFRCK
ncbi:alpha-amylase family glycosyl hydrolase [Butyrivibrio sp. MC2013]|uniref:alpha-amylase family glycosyl hydrolase n=1 Tax=Butyrivibrio sp. MC2013 TaxID=1280686 RepID=UPI00041D92CF|nr:alpha-amylase family glycosyl hydrolase [Butyrivibrio sp. MC2013]